MIADVGGGVCVICNTCPALGPIVATRSWRTARDAAAGWRVGRGLDTTDACPACAITPATRPLVEDPCPDPTAHPTPIRARSRTPSVTGSRAAG